MRSWSSVDARRAKFISSALHNARLDDANLVRADLTNADLTGASLVGVDLTSARMFGADLSRADLTGARLASTDLLKAILAGATWIDGKTICAEDSVGQCQPRARSQRESARSSRAADSARHAQWISREPLRSSVQQLGRRQGRANR